MNLTEDKSRMQSNTLRVAFFGLAVSELDLFTLVRRAAGATLVLVVDPGPLGVARKLAEIAGVQIGASAWDLPKAGPDWIVTGKLAAGAAAPLRRSVESGAIVLEAAEAVRRLKAFSEGRAGDRVERKGVAAAPLRDGAATRREESPARREESAAEPSAGPAAEGKVLSGEAGPSPHPAFSIAPPVGDLEESWVERFAARSDWAPPECEAVWEAPKVMSKSTSPERTPLLHPAAVPAHRPAAQSAPERETTAREHDTAVPARQDMVPPHPATAPAHRSAAATVLRSAVDKIGTDEIVRWALDGLMSSVKSMWGVALARAKDDVCLVQKGIEIERARPDLWGWLKGTVEGNGGEGHLNPPPPDSGTLAWVTLKSNSLVLGTLVLGRGADEDPFSPSDKTWLEKVGERIASILCNTSGSVSVQASDEYPSAPVAVWAAPLLERAVWARGWMKSHFGATGCWLFAVPAGSTEPHLVDESWGSVPPPFLARTVTSAMERPEARVWVDGDEERAIVLQPLGPWGVEWVVVLEGVPWRGDGRPTRARLKKAAATLAKVLREA